ncbi:MAG: hypothetical protein HY867_01460 [Chloroflexi bacterium]|nr:hypothetical protein [Chloroflexota bacterium]
MPMDLNLLSLYRANGQEQVAQPGLMAYAPPRKAARGREREWLLISLLLNGNRPFEAEEYEALTNAAAFAFHNMHGALTAALRAAADSINNTLLERNLSTTGRGQYAIGWVTLAALRDSQLTILQCGPTHVLALNAGAPRHIHDPALAGKGLGLSQGINRFFSQLQLQPGDRLLLCPKLPPAWADALTSDRGLPAPESTRKRLLAVADGDVNGALIQVTDGTGGIHFLLPDAPHPSNPEADATPQAFQPAPAALPPAPVEFFPEPEPIPSFTPPAAHVVGRPPEDAPSAYAIPPQSVDADEELVERLAEMALARQFPSSIPRAGEEADYDAPPAEGQEEEAEIETVDVTSTPRPSAEEIAQRRAESQRQMARAAVGGINAWRNFTGQAGARLRKFLPNLLPGGESDISLPVPAMAFISILVPLLIVTIAVVVYMRFGRSSQYETSLAQAIELRASAVEQTDPLRQYETWNAVLQYATKAEEYNPTNDAASIKQEAQTQLDALLGVTRLRFSPIFNAPLDAQISRMAVSDSDLFMLDASSGKILRAAVNGRGHMLDENFDCKPGLYGDKSVGSLIDLQALPKENTLNSSVLGVDAAGNLLYCAQGQVSRPMSLTPPSTNWGRVTAIALDSGRLYVLDAPARAVWVYANDKEGVFTDAPLFFFGNQIPEIQDAIDIAVSSDGLFLLHADGRVTFCTNIEGSPARCESPVQLINRFPAYGSRNVFTEAHYTQMILTGPPDSTLLLLDAEGQSIHRLGSHGFELMGILGASAGTIPAGPLGALATAPNHILYLALGGQVYVTADAP